MFSFNFRATKNVTNSRKVVERRHVLEAVGLNFSLSFHNYLCKYKRVTVL